jgi:PAS domain S-box-containing protein
MKKVLVVDNHPVILKWMTNLLEKEGHQVITAQDGLSAVDVLKTYVPDVMFVDLVMPNIGGEKLCRIVRSMPQLRDVYLVILSAIAGEEKIDFAGLGANACIAKESFEKMSRHVLAVLDQSENSHAPPSKTEGPEETYQLVIRKELLSSQRHFELILSAMSEGILELTFEARIVYANPAAISLIGVPEEKLLATSLTEMFHDSHRQRIEEMLNAAVGAPQTIGEDSPVTLNGKQITVNVLSVEDEEHKPIIVILNDVSERKRAEEDREKLIKELQYALAEVKTLSGLLPICSSCKKIRDDRGYWNQIESFIRDHSEAEFSHGICPECAQEHYPDLYPPEKG